MKTDNEKFLTRQQKLKIWIIENDFNLARFAELCGVSRQLVQCEMNYRETMAPALHAECINAGIPENLLPPPTRPKAALLRENLELRERLAKYEPLQAQTG